MSQQNLSQITLNTFEKCGALVAILQTYSFGTLIKRRYKLREDTYFLLALPKNMIVIIEMQLIYHVSKTRQLLRDLI